MLTQGLIFLIRQYQRFLSPLTGRSCRFYPSCSQYAIDSLHKHGLRKGALQSLARILRCNPVHRGGIDPVM